MSVVIPIGDCGGYGDIAASMALCEYFDEKGIDYSLFFWGMDTAKEKFLELSQRKNIPQDIKGRPVCVTASDPSTMRNCFVTRNKKKYSYQQIPSKAVINIREYNPTALNEYSDYDSDYIEMRTGFGSIKNGKDVEAGIYERKTLEDMLEGVKPDANEHKRQFLDNMLPKSNLVLETVADSSWALAYGSSLMQNWLYLDLAKIAEKKLKRPLTIFCANPPEQRKEVYDKSVRLGFNYHNPRESESYQTDSNILVVDLETLPEKDFMRLVSLLDSVSLVTGDHSLSQMIQKSRSGNPAPFFYLMADWKCSLATSLDLLLRKTSKTAANAFSGFVYQSERFHTRKRLPAYCTNNNFLARMFYDEQLIDEFNDAAASIKPQLVKERMDAGIEEPKLLVNVQDTVGFLVDRLQEGASSHEAVQPLLPKK